MLTYILKLQMFFIEKMCLASALPTLGNATFVSSNYPVGASVSYTCSPDYRLAPGLPASTARVQNITCQADGTFTALPYTCVCK